MPSTTLSALLATNPDTDLIFTCNSRNPEAVAAHRIAMRYATHVKLADAITLYGADATLDQIKARLVCSLCGARAPEVLVEVFARQPGYSAGGYRHPEG